MKKIMKVSLVAMFVAVPMIASAATVPVAYVGSATVGQNGQLSAVTASADVASTSYVKGAYNELAQAINEVNATAGFAGTESALTDTHFQTADKTSAAAAANAAMTAAQTGITNAAAAQAAADAAQADADALEGIVGNTSLQTTSQTVTEAINEINTAAGFAGTASALTDTHFQQADKASAAAAANAAMTAAQTGITNAAAAQADADALEGIVGNTSLQTSAQTVTAAINELNTAAQNKYVTVHTTWGNDSATTSANVLTNVAPSN